MSIQILNALSVQKFSEHDDQAQEEWTFSRSRLIRYSGFLVTVCIYEARM